MQTILAYIYFGLANIALWLRYRIKESGIHKIEGLNKEKGILFLANHPAEIDPLILLKLFWMRFRIHPITIEFLFHIPVVGYLLRFVGCIAIPDFDTSSNSYKQKRIEAVYNQVFALLAKGENVLIYPAGGLKQNAHEAIGGASGVHHILQKMDDVNIVLVRTTGLWGSSFSRAQTGKSPQLIPTFFHGFKVLLKNGIFFAPRRKVLVECEVANKDFPRKGSKLEINRYLERWFNAKGDEPLQLVSYSFWKKEVPKVYSPKATEELAMDKVPLEIQERVYTEIALLAGRPRAELNPNLDLAKDLGFDSLDIAQIVLLLKEQFGLTQINSSDLTSIGKVMIYAAKLKESGNEEEGEKAVKKGVLWKKEKARPPTKPPEGANLVEAFLCTTYRMKSALACADSHVGQVTYKDLKRAAIALAFKIRELEGEKIAIMLPASVGVNLLILATLLAGKVPVMINWTLGRRNLESVIAQTGIKHTLSSWSFLDRLENADLNGVDETLLFLEDIKHSIGFKLKLKVLFYQTLSLPSLMKKFKVSSIRSDDPAVILFTSGTESEPKGVPLSHYNLLSNVRGAFEYVNIHSSDVLLGMLPPFHSFGFSITGLLPLLSGIRTVYSPNPTDGRRIASVIENWGVTICCSAPTFLRTIIRCSKKEQLQSLRLVVTGAEKISSELCEKIYALNNKLKIIEGYGITECSPILTLNPPDRPQDGVGLPLPSVTLKVVHPESYESLNQGETGLILASGPNIFSGYLDKKICSPFVEIEGKMWYQTGDLGYLNERGYLVLSGRLKRFVKIGGEMVSLGAIEEVLSQAASKNQWPIDQERPSFALCSVEEEGEKSKLYLFVTFPLQKERVNELLRESGMSNLVKVSGVRQVNYLPLLGSGKIDYRKLTEQVKSEYK